VVFYLIYLQELKLFIVYIDKKNSQKSDCSHYFLEKFAANLGGLKGIGSEEGNSFIYQPRTTHDSTSLDGC